MSDDRNIREEALGVVTRNDAPDGQGWSCPNCDHWASIGENRHDWRVARRGWMGWPPQPGERGRLR